MKFQIKVGVKDLFRFNMRHSYLRFSGILTIVIGVMIAGAAIAFWGSNSNAYSAFVLFMGLLFIFWGPFTIYKKCVVNARKGDFKDPFFYEFTEEGILVTQEERNAKCGWQDVMKMTETRTALYLYMDRMHAHIIPKTCLGKGEREVAVFIQEHIKAAKDKRTQGSEE